MNPAITLELTLQEVNGILAGLGTLPHNQVAPLFEKVRAQTVAQVKAAEEAAKNQPEPAA